jgi:DNA replication protein DnaC
MNSIVARLCIIDDITTPESKSLEECFINELLHARRLHSNVSLNEFQAQFQQSVLLFHLIDDEYEKRYHGIEGVYNFRKLDNSFEYYLTFPV